MLQNSARPPRKCGICHKEESKYTCPKCYITYCSLVCYKDKEHASCSETFYKDWVFEEMKDIGSSSPENKQKIIGALKKCMNIDKVPEELENYQTVNEDEAGNTQSLDERLQGVSLDDSVATWNSLTCKEKEEFLKSLEADELPYLSSWSPWWKKEYAKIRPVVSKKSDQESEEIQLANEVLRKPLPIKEQKEIKHVLKSAKPNVNIFNDVIEVLFVYTFISRLYNGNLKDDLERVMQEFIGMSEVFSKGRTYCDVDSALQNVILKVQSTDCYSGVADRLQTSLDDLLAILTSNSNHVISYPFPYIALLNIKELLVDLKKTVDKDEKNSVRRNIKKIEFYIIWMRQYAKELELQAELVRLKSLDFSANEEQYQSTKVQVEKSMNKLKAKPPYALIQEI